MTGAFVGGGLRFSRGPLRQRQHVMRRVRAWTCQASAGSSDGASVTQSPPQASFQRAEDVFSEDAGKDLFFPALTEEKAIELVTTPSAQLEDDSERYIGAERLKFYPSENSTEALIKCIQDTSSTTTADEIARRKSVESLGRFKGQYQREKVIDVITGVLEHPNSFTAEVAVWALAEIDAQNSVVLEKMENLLEREGMNKRVVIQGLSSLKATQAVPKIREFLEDPDPATRCSAIGAVCSLTGDASDMGGVIEILQSTDLNVRRAAIEDITRMKYEPALYDVIKAPNSIVLRARAVREILEVAVPAGDITYDEALERTIDHLIWDNPNRIDLLGVRADTKKARSIKRCVERLYKNDALYSYLGARTLLEDYKQDEEAGKEVLDSFKAMKYFDYFAAYHVFKALAWTEYKEAEDLLLENFQTLPPRFYNHQAAAALALAKIGSKKSIPDITEIGKRTKIWELKYACLIASEMLDPEHQLRKLLVDDADWLLQSRAKSSLDFDHLLE